MFKQTICNQSADLDQMKNSFLSASNRRQTIHMPATIHYVDVANSWMVQADANTC